MKTKIAIYYVLVISSCLIFAMIFPQYLSINIASAVPVILALVSIFDITKIGKKLDPINKLFLMKYSRSANDSTDTNGKLSYDKNKFNDLYEGRNEHEKKLTKNATLLQMLVAVLFIIPFLFFSTTVKVMVSIAIYYVMLAIYALLNRKMWKEIEKEENEREKQIEKELEEQKKREELGKWK